jgi:hypothetical protein
MQIIIRTSIEPDAWDNECDARTAQAAAEKLAKALEAYAVEMWHQAEIDARIQTYCGQSEPFLELRGVDDADGRLWQEINAALEQLGDHLWVGCLQSAIDEINA